MLQLRRLTIAALPLAGMAVHADDSKEAKKVKIQQLSLYKDPESMNKYDYIEEKITPYRENISKARVFVTDCLDVVKSRGKKAAEYYSGVSDTIGKLTTEDYLKYGTATFLIGTSLLVLRGKRSVKTKLVYVTLATVGSAGLLFPSQIQAGAEEATKQIKDLFTNK